MNAQPSARGRAALRAALLILLFAPLYAQAQSLPPVEASAHDSLLSSPRHGEWVSCQVPGGDSVDAWVVYPERPDPAPVVLVIHEIFGLSDWVRAVADRLAAEGFIAIVPDLLSGKGPGGRGSSSVDADGARALIAKLDPAEVARRLDAAVDYATALPAATKKFGVVGFCWGGGASFSYATQRPDLGASVVYYGTPPSEGDMARIQAPVLAFYGGSDARVTSTSGPTASALERLGKSFEYQIYQGAGHAFLRQQEGMSGANLRASQDAWPRTLAFLRDKLESPATSAAGLGPMLGLESSAPDDCCAPVEGEATALLQ
jgi:carboxymethylenebutenolidase